MTLAEQLKRLRTERGMDLSQLAERAGVSEDDLRRLETGDGEVNLADVVKISRVLWGEIEFVPDPVLRIIDEIVGADGIEQESVSTHFELSNGLVIVKGTVLSLSRLFAAFGEGLSAREFSAATGIPRDVICGALQELAAKMDHYPPRQG
jgi:transcriptional regulator with XRE-family HTH domain